MSAPRRPALLALLLAGCAAPPEAVAPRSFGTMREVLRMGRDHGRVAIADVTGSDSVGVGALAGLAGEVTIYDGRALVAERRGDDVVTRPPRPGEQAALLVTAEVDAWTASPLPPCQDYAALEEQVRRALLAAGFDPSEPTPILVRGAAPQLQMHVIAGACPIATPDGPSPWRFDGAAEQVTLVGFYVEGAAGRLTHHTHRSHLHAVTDRGAGHLDEVRLMDGELFLPAR